MATKICSVDGCDRKAAGRGLCHAHYKRLIRWGDPLGGFAPRVRLHTVCTIEGCDKPHYAHGYCSAHYTRFYRKQDLNTSFRQRVKEVSIDEVVRLYVDEKWSTIQISKHFNIADVTLSKMLKEHGVALRGIYGPRPVSRTTRSKLNEQLIVNTYLAIDDIGVAELARLHNVRGSTTIKTILLDHGVAIRPIAKVRHGGKWKAGSDSPFWNPSLTAEHRAKLRPKIQVEAWRLDVFRRDGFECQSCESFNKRDSRLEAHHIESWSTCVEKRFDVANGITICRKCHIEFHRRFGKKHNNRLQLAQFLAPAMEIAA